MDLLSCYYYSMVIFAFNLILSLCPISLAINEILIAINAGGREHIDSNNVRYQADDAPRQDGSTASDYGRRFVQMGRVHPEDLELYQTERYHTSDFEYRFPMDRKKVKDGNYVLVLKFSEVYFQSTGEKVFNVEFNSHEVIENLDIFAEARGQAVAYDKVVPFTIKNNKLLVLDQKSDFDGTFTITFKKGHRDNPKVNAFYIMRGTIDDVPPLPDLTEDEMLHSGADEYVHKDEQPPVEDEEELEDVRAKYASGPSTLDPYAQQDVSQMFIPILIALACFFPVLFCLCRL